MLNKFILIFFLLLPLICKSQKIIDKPDVEAKFPGGTSEMYKFLGRNIMYSESAIKANVSGRIVVSFNVNVDGSLQNIELLKDPGFGIGEEVVRVVKSMPNWEPGTKSSQPVQSRYILPVNIDPE